MTNAPVKEEKRRGRSLFQKVTGAVNGLVTDDRAPAVREPQLRREPVSYSTPAPAQETIAETAPQAAQPATTPAPLPVQPSLSNLDRTEPSSISSGDEDILEIPAFLRRQAN